VTFAVAFRVFFVIVFVVMMLVVGMRVMIIIVAKEAGFMPAQVMRSFERRIWWFGPVWSVVVVMAKR